MKNIYLGLLLTCALFTLQGTNCRAQNKPVFSIPFTLIDNRPFIEVRIRQHTFHFILDSGGDYGLDLSTAKILNLPLGHPDMQGGAGAKLVPHWTTVADTARMGRAVVLKQRFLVTDLSEIKNKLKLPYLDGVMGYGFMRDYAVQFDYPKMMINFYASYVGVDPVTFSLYYGQIPQINVQIDGNNATVIIDTGDRTAFTILNHFAVKTGLINNYHLSATAITGYGIGGPIYARTLNLKQLEIGDIKLTNVPSRIPMLTSGAFAETNIDGSIGGGVLKKYKFTIDYKKQRLYFE